MHAKIGNSELQRAKNRRATEERASLPSNFALIENKRNAANIGILIGILILFSQRDIPTDRMILDLSIIVIYEISTLHKIIDIPKSIIFNSQFIKYYYYYRLNDIPTIYLFDEE